MKNCMWGGSMIEIIYSNENREESGKDTGIKLPKNIRQIGDDDGNKKIYIEDYVMTYIGKLWELPLDSAVIGVLLGKVKRSNGNTYLFASGAIQVNNAEKDGRKILFSDETWTSIYEDIKKYFNDLEIVGWFLAGGDTGIEIDESLFRTHIDNFAGIDKALLLIDPIEKEEEFYFYEGGKLTKQKGYYIYYERNEQMQAYMVETKQGKKVDTVTYDRVPGNFRSIIQEKKENTSQKRLVAMLYSACTFLAVVVLVIGITMMNNYDKMRSMEESLDALTKNLLKINVETSNPLNEWETDLAEASTEQVIVEVVEGNVETTTQVAETEEVTTTVVETTEVLETTTASIEPVVEPTAPTVSEVSYHVVQPGESLIAISIAVYQTDTMVDEIKEMNGIEDEDKIYAGQKLQLP